MAFQCHGEEIVALSPALAINRRPDIFHLGQEGVNPFVVSPHVFQRVREAMAVEALFNVLK